MIFVLQMLCLASSFSRSIIGPLDKGYELFHPAKQIPSRLDETMRFGSRKNGGNNNPIHAKGQGRRRAA